MKRLFIILVLALGLSLLFGHQKAYAGWVNGHTRSDGTYVNGYWRSDPNGLKYDNYSFDGDWSDAFNDSYFSPSRDYSSDWYTPAWFTQNDYYVGKSFYDSRNNYSGFDYKNYDYDYSFWDDPIYDYTPSYDYGYNYLDSYNSYKSPYSSSLNFDSYNSSFDSDFNNSYDYDFGSSYDYDSSYSNSYDSFDSCSYSYLSCY